MSSNVLKSLSDCYNFKDDSNDSKSKAKKRQRMPTNSTSKTTNAKTLTAHKREESNSVPKVGLKRRCDAMESVLKSGLWMNDIRADNRSVIDSVLELLSKHMTDECNCVNICSTHLMFGNTYFESFLFNLKDFENKVINEENKCSDSQTNNVCLKNSVINDIPINKVSKLEANVMLDLVNFMNMSALLTPLDEAVNHWQKALELNTKLMVLNEELINKFKIYFNLCSVIQIYAFYSRIESQLKATRLLNKFCLHFGNKNSEMSLTANYYLVKIYIELGALNKAYKCLRSLYSSSSPNSDKQMPQTYGKSLILLAKCELDLLRGQTERAAKTMKCFIDSEYLKKLTINRYYIKGLCFLLASKFSSKDYNFMDCFQEFIEPIQMAICILKRWNPWLSTSMSKVNNENLAINAGDLDPFWYKFAVMNFAYESMQLSIKFYQNIGLPVDSFFYFNSLMKLGRRYCATVRISKLLIIGSQLDVICDHKNSAQIKLSNASLCLRSNNWSLDSVSVFDSLSSSSTTSPDAREAIDGSHDRRVSSIKSDSECEIIEIKSIESSTNFEALESENCEHHQSSSLWEMKKKFRQIENKCNDSSDSEDSISERNKNRIFRTITEKDNNPKEIIEFFLIRIEIEFFRLLIDENDSKYVLTQLNDIYKNSIEGFASNGLKQAIERILNGYNSETMLENYSYYKYLKFKFIETIARFQMENKEFEEAINTCLIIKNWKALNYEQRMIKSNLLYFEAFSKLILYKSKHNISDANVWIEYTNNLIESVSNETSIANTDSDSLTPPRPLNKIKALAPKAPKHRQFKNDEIQDYVTALSNHVCDESTNKSQNPFRLKSDPKLNFETDSELRSHSITESNEKSIEIKISAKTQDITKHKPFIRMTRSRTTLSKKEDICVKNEKKVDKSSQNITKSSKSKTISSEVLDIGMDFDKQIEELDEVFDQKLNINENLEINKKFSKDNDLDLDSIIRLLKQVFDLMSSHPSSKLYVSIHKLLTQIYSLESICNEDKVGYHYSESNGLTYRYRNIFIAEKKRRLNRISKYDLQSIVFNEMNGKSNTSVKSMTNGLPNDWRVIQISTANNDSKFPDLMVCRYQSGKRPVFLRIKSDSQKIIKHFMTQFNDIIERSNASIVNKDRETFWRLRFSLDEELMILLRSVEETWFGPFKGILLGQLQSQSYQNMCALLHSYIMALAQKEGLICVSLQLLEVIVESLPSLKYSEFRAALKILFSTSNNSFVSKCFAKYERMFNELFPIDNKESIFTKYVISPVALILDKSLESFPFESLPSIQTYSQSIFRTPSLRILSLMYNTFKEKVNGEGLNESNVYYVLNPADNLAKTEEYFKEAFVAMKDWHGVIGKPPPPLDLKEAFDSKEAYIFFGHGAGASYYRTIPEGLDGCNVNCASIVIGCSSGKLFSEGKQLESYGTPYRFMMNGSPCFVGVLWDVTDKDIDKFSDQLLHFGFSNWKPELQPKEVMPITRAVSMSRKSCKLKHLIGAAPVVYGLPLFTKSKLS